MSNTTDLDEAVRKGLITEQEAEQERARRAAAAFLRQRNQARQESQAAGQ